MHSYRLFALAALSVLVTFVSPVGAQTSSYAAAPYIQRLTPHEARQHLDNLRSRHPGIFQKAAAILEEQGFRDTGHVEVFRTNRNASARLGNPGSILLAQMSESNSEGEVVLWSWDDGNYDTWEGNVYVHDYVTGNWISVDTQVSVLENSEFTLYWSEPVGGYENPRDPRDRQIRWNGGKRGSIANAALQQSSALRQPFYHASINWSGIMSKWNAWASCSASWCVGSAMFCQRRNPTPAEKPDIAICTAFTCAVAGLSCLDKLR